MASSSFFKQNLLSDSLWSPSSHQEPAESELEDPFRRLPDELLLVIINKLFQAKSLIQLSLVSKRFFSLVFQTHSVFVDLDFRDGPSFVGRLFGFLKKLVTRTWTTPTIPGSNSLNLYDILQPFEQIKHLHVHLSCLDSADQKSLESDTFIRWVAAFGSHVEFLQLVSAQSVNRSIPNPCVASAHGAGAVDVFTQGNLNDELRQRVLKLLATALGIATRVHDMIREHVLEHEMLESVVFSHGYGSVVMGKEQIARLRSSSTSNQEQGLSDVVVFGSYVPTLDLLELGYTLKHAMFVNLENMAVMCGADQDVDAELMNVSVLDLHDSQSNKHWQVFDEAVQLLMKEEMHIIFEPGL